MGTAGVSEQVLCVRTGSNAMSACSDYAAQLAEAKTALHKLTIGSKAESIHDGEKSLQYTRADLASLRSYVASLQAKVDACNGVRTNHRRIMNVLPLG